MVTKNKNFKLNKTGTWSDIRASTMDARSHALSPEIELGDDQASIAGVDHARGRSRVQSLIAGARPRPSPMFFSFFLNFKLFNPNLNHNKYSIFSTFHTPNLSLSLIYSPNIHTFNNGSESIPKPP